MQRLEQVPAPGGSATNLMAATRGLTSPPAREWDNFDDLGPELTLARRPKPTVFEFSADTQYSFVSNIALTPNNQKSDGELFETLSLSASPRLVPGLISKVFLNQQFIRYNTYTGTNFDGQTAGVSLSHPIGPNGNWFTLYTEFAATRLCHPWDAGEFYKEFDTRLGLVRSQALGRYVTIYYGYQLDWLPSHPAMWTRVNNALYGGVNVLVTEKLQAQLFYRLRDQDYLQFTPVRNDLDHLVNLTLSYTWNRYLVTRIYGSYGNSASNRSVYQSAYNYQVANGGGGLALSLKF